MNENTINADVTMEGVADALLAGRYRVVKQLGQGGMGSVWLAEDTQLDNRQVAIKMLPSVLVSNKRAYNQLKAEALVSLKLTHPNIATVRAFEENNGNPFLVVDYIDGITLDDYLAEYGGRAVGAGRRPYRVEDGGGAVDAGHRPYRSHPGRAVAPRPPSGGGLPEAEVIRLLAPIAAALDYAHAKGVIHRDVKPGNMMIAKDGTPYILDFGIAREIQETMTRVTGKLSSGTLMYMSPEQLHGAAPTPTQDVYSFAAMAYECLTGHPPFSRGQIEYQIEHDDPETLPSHIAISDGIMAGLAKRPEDRSANCAAVLAGDGGRGATALPVRDETAAASDGRARTPAAPHTPSSPHENGRARAPRGPRRWLADTVLVAVVFAVGVFAWLQHDADSTTAMIARLEADAKSLSDEREISESKAEIKRLEGQLKRERKARESASGVQLWKDGPYWAECNVGATKPEETGYYFWWGDTMGCQYVGNRWQAVDGSKRYFPFDEENCPTCGKDDFQLRAAGYVDETGNLTPAHDAARVYLGEPWRMPTQEELDTLLKNCTSEWTQRNSVYGRLVTGKGAFATKSIFLPAAGFGSRSSPDDIGSIGCYWSSTPRSVCSDNAWRLYFNAGDFHRHNSSYCYLGQSVRAVRGFTK